MDCLRRESRVMSDKVGKVLGILIVVLIILAAAFLIFAVVTNVEGWFYASLGCVVTENVLNIVKSFLINRNK